MKISLVFNLALTLLQGINSTPKPDFFIPSYKSYDYGVPRVTSYNYVIPHQAQSFYNNPPLLPPPDKFPVLNILAEVPTSISNSFTVVPMVIVAKESMKMITQGEIMKISKDKPEMTVKVDNQNFLQATPAVKIVLDTPMLVYSVRSKILFPARMDIVHQGYKLPIRVGAIIAPVLYETFIRSSGPISLSEVYAIPEEPVLVDYVNNDVGVIIKPDDEAVVLEHNPDLQQPPKNITVLLFPDSIASPTLGHNEEDDELVNRNPPFALAPAGVVGSTQPVIYETVFSNSKESPVLTILRGEALKRY